MKREVGESYGKDKDNTLGWLDKKIVIFTVEKYFLSSMNNENILLTK